MRILRRPSDNTGPWLATLAIAALTATVVLINVRTPVPDSVLALDLTPSKFLGELFRSWSNVDLGQRVLANGASVAYLPVALFYVLLKGAGLSLLEIQRIVVSGIIFASATGMLVLYRTWWGDSATLRALAAAVLYGLSPYILLDVKPATVMLLPYAGLPWIAYHTIRAVRDQRARHIVAIGVITGILVPGINPPLMVILALCVGLLGLAEVKRFNYSRATRRWLLAAAISAAVASSWWVGPFLSSLQSGGVHAYFLSDPLSMDAAASSFRAVLRLAGLWALYQNWAGIPYYSSQTYLLSQPVVAITLFAPCAAVFAIWRLWSDVRARALLSLMVVAVPMAVSVYPISHPGPTGLIYLWLYRNVFAFRAFRSNYTFVWVLAFVYALAIPALTYGVSASKLRFGNHLRPGHVLAWCLTGCLLGTYIVPYLNGDLFPVNYRLGSVPQYWYQAAAWLNRQPPGGRVLFLPEQGFSVYNWGSPEGDLAWELLRRPELTDEIDLVFTPEAQQLMAMVGAAPTNPDIPFAKVLALLDVSYVVQRNDVNWQYYGSTRPHIMQKFLSSQPCLIHRATFGALEVFQVKRTSSFQRSFVGVAKARAVVASDTGLASSVREWRIGSLAELEVAETRNSDVRAWSASSVFDGQYATYGPQVAFDGERNVAWVSNVPFGVGQWVEAEFVRPRRVSRVEIVARKDGVDALPTKLAVSAGGRTVRVPVSSAGVAVANLDERRAASVRVTILASGPGGANVGLSIIHIDGLPPNTIAYPDLASGEPAAYVLHFLAPGTENLSHVVESEAVQSATITGTLQSAPDLSNAALASYLRPTGVTAVTASSRFDNMAAYSPLWAIAGDPAMSWVSNVPGGVGQWIQFAFPGKRWVGTVTVRGRNDGVDSEATLLGLSSNGVRLGTQHLGWSKRGEATIVVNRELSSLRLTILASQTGRPSHNVGFAVQIAGVGVRRQASVLVPKSFSMNGAEVPVSLGSLASVPKLASGIPSVDDALAAGLATRPFAARVVLHSGPNTFDQPADTFMAVSKCVISVGSQSAAAITWIPAKELGPGRLVTSIPAEEQFLLLDETANPQWTAIGHGQRLAAAGVSDGYASTWRLDGARGTANIVFEVGIDSRIWLAMWAGALVVVCGIALWLMFRLGRRRGTRGDG